MVKSAFKDESDTFEELSEQEVKSPKKRKTAAKKEESASPDGKEKSGRAPSAWTKEEEADLMDCVHAVLVANMTQAVKEYPRHWNAIRRKHEVAVLGAATVDTNGRKLIGADKAKPSTSKTE